MPAREREPAQRYPFDTDRDEYEGIATNIRLLDVLNVERHEVFGIEEWDPPEES